MDQRISETATPKQVYILLSVSLFINIDKSAEAGAADHTHHKCLADAMRMYQLTPTGKLKATGTQFQGWNHASATLNKPTDTADLARTSVRNSKTWEKTNY